MKWLNEFKVALLQKNDTRLASLIEEMPDFKEVENMIEARDLIGEAIEYFKAEKMECAKEMQRLQKMRSFFQSNPSHDKLSLTF